MLTSQLFEQWDVDVELLVRQVHARVGPGAVYIGGSLADDLGNDGSDADLFCFTEAHSGDAPAASTFHVGGAVVDLRVVSGPFSAGPNESLLPLVLGPPDMAVADLPLLPAGSFQMLHALYRDRVLHPDVVAEAARTAYASDLLHLYTAVHSTLACAALADDLIAQRGSGDLDAAIYSARLACEVAIDAALATEGLVTVNPKWRFTLLQKAGMQSGMPPAHLTRRGLFPDPSDGVAALRTCLQAAQANVAHTLSDITLARLDLVRDAAQVLDDALVAWGA
jgi:hypothetical protein